MKQFLQVKLLVLISTGCWCAFSQVPAQNRNQASPDSPLGSVVEVTEPCPAGPLADTTCRRLQVSCADLKTADVQIRITEPPAGVALRGTVVISSGGRGGAGFYGGQGGGQILVRELAAMGFRLVDRAWANGWPTHEAGLRKEACRYATLLTWIHDHLHTRGKFVATGNSGGSSEIGYALTSWRRGDILDLAVPSSGPPVGRMDYTCFKQASPEWAALCSSIVPRGARECSQTECMLPGGPSNVSCTQASLKPTLEFLRVDSVMNPDAVLNYPKTRVHFLFGALDCDVPVPAGLTWATKVTSEKIIEFVPKTPHTLSSTPEGREAIRKAIDLGTAKRTSKP